MQHSQFLIRGIRMLTVDQIKGIISSQKANFKIPGNKELAVQEVSSLLNKLVKFANDLYVDDTFTNYSEVWFYTSPNLKLLDHIEISNIFQLHYVLNIKLFALKHSIDTYVIYSDSYSGYVFAEIVSDDIYEAIYKDIVTTIHSVDMFKPLR